MWLTSFASNSKEELHQALGGEEICLLGISYSDVQSLSCRSTPKQGNCTLPRCKSYRLRKNSPLGIYFYFLAHSCIITKIIRALNLFKMIVKR